MILPYQQLAFTILKCRLPIRFLSSTNKKISKLNIFSSKLPNDSICIVKLNAAWQDYAVFNEIPINSTIKYNEITESCDISIANELEIEPVVDITVPEMCDLNIIGNNIKLILSKKIMGEVMINCKSGSVVVDKIRGEKLTFDIGEADLSILKLIEGNKCIINCRNLTAKMINGNDITINSNEAINIEAMYPAKSKLFCNRTMNISLLRGHLDATSTEGDILIEGIDGSYNVNALKGRVDLQINKLFAFSKSLASSMKSIGVKIDPSITTSLYCESSASATRGSIKVISDSFVQENTAIDNDGLTNVITGIIQGLAKDSNNHSSTSGKINIAGAESQSLSSVIDSRNSQNNLIEIPALEFRAKGHIRLETLSWMDLIKRKHGFDISTTTNSSKIKLGRTATANQRAQELIKFQQLNNENDKNNST